MPLSRDRSGALLISRTSLLHTAFCATVLCLSSLFVSYKVFSTLIRSDAKSFEIVRVVSYAAQQANVAAVALMLLQGKYRKLLLFCQWAQNMKINNTTIQHCKLPTTFYFFLHTTSDIFNVIIHGVDRASMISFAKRITFYWILDDGVRAVAILLGSTQVKTKIDQIELRLRKMVNELDPSNRIENKNIISLFHETALNNTSLSACDVFQIDVNMIAIAAASIITNVAIMFQSFLSVKTLGN
ncbi:Hypothetical predicted protein [Cloeon dipterum]|uniref:Uncharacterized protein n=1 Tax=Cloeon dipterum TaxID=197152 RepID=A0A8S1DWQ7_9INSE|nr:Hypothetical predicted protein [Cloeon dipterum]